MDTPNPNVLSMWTIYDHPEDYPNTFVARRQDIHAGVVEHTREIMVSPDLESIRRQLRSRGLIALARQPEDDPIIVEVWF